MWLIPFLLLVFPIICFYPYVAGGFILFSKICCLIHSLAPIALALATTGGSFLWLTELLTHTDVPMSLWEAETEEVIVTSNSSPNFPVTFVMSLPPSPVLYLCSQPDTLCLSSLLLWL